MVGMRTESSPGLSPETGAPCIACQKLVLPSSVVPRNRSSGET